MQIHETFCEAKRKKKKVGWWDGCDIFWVAKRGEPPNIKITK